MTKPTIAPRPGVKAIHRLTFNLSAPAELGEREQAELQSDINERFRQPSEMGKLAITFTGKVTQPWLIRDEVQIELTTSEINDEIVSEIASIVESRTGVKVTGWTSDAKIIRKSFGVDEA